MSILIHQILLGPSDFFRFSRQQVNDYLDGPMGLDVIFKDYPNSNGVLPFGVRIEKNFHSLSRQFQGERTNMFRIRLIMPTDETGCSYKFSQNPYEDLILPALEAINEDPKLLAEIKNTLRPYLKSQNSQGDYLGPYTLSQTEALVCMLHDLSLYYHLTKARPYERMDLMNFDIEMANFVDSMEAPYRNAPAPSGMH